MPSLIFLVVVGAGKAQRLTTGRQRPHVKCKVNEKSSNSMDLVLNLRKFKYLIMMVKFPFLDTRKTVVEPGMLR